VKRDINKHHYAAKVYYKKNFDAHPNKPRLKVNNVITIIGYDPE